MTFLRNLQGPKAHLSILLVIAVLAIDALSFIGAERTAARAVSDQLVASDLISDLVHELQRERGYSTGNLAGGGLVLRDALHGQRVRTSAAMEDVFTTSPDRFPQQIRDRILWQLDSVAGLRAQVDAQSASPEDIAAAYTVIVDVLLDATRRPFGAGDGNGMLSLIEAMQSIHMAKEAAGLQRAMGAAILGAGWVDVALHDRFVALGAREAAFLQEARYYLGHTAFDFPNLSAHPTLDAVETLRREIAGFEIGRIEHSVLTAEIWFETSTDWIDSLRQVEQEMAVLVSDLATAQQQRANRVILSRAALVILSLGLLAVQLLPNRAPSRFFDPSTGDTQKRESGGLHG